MSSKRKLVWVECTDDGRPYATGDMIDAFHAAYDAAGFNPFSRGIDAALEAGCSDALLVSEGEVAALAGILDSGAFSLCNRRDTAAYASYRDSARGKAWQVIEAGYRKVTALDRETLVEAIAAAYSENCTDYACWNVAPCNDCKRKALALISRAEGTV